MLRLAVPLVLALTPMDYVNQLAPIFARIGITVVPGCPIGLQGEFRPVQRTICFDRDVLGGPAEDSIRLMAHEAAHAAQWCAAGRGGRSYRRLSDGAIRSWSHSAFVRSLEAEAYALEDQPQTVIALLKRHCLP